MPVGSNPLDLRESKLRDWMLSLLRFAITQAPEDQTAVVVLAGELDAQGDANSLTFFRRTSVSVCHAIVVRDEDGKRILKQHISRIEESRLRDAFAAAIGFDVVAAGRHRKKAEHKISSASLWRGLP